MKTLIIGANGYIGSRLYESLESEVIGVDINWFSAHQPEVLVCDYSELTDSYLEQFNTIVLLAGHSSVKMCDGPLQDVWFNNISNFLNLVKKINKEQILIYASSGSIYSATSNDNFVPINNYDLTKYVLDLQARLLIDQGYKLIGLRLGTVNGFSKNFRSELMLNSMTSSAINNKHIILTNLSTRRPILGIRDLSKAIQSIILRPTPGIYDLCSFNSTVEELGNTVAEYFGVPVTIGQNLTNVYNFKFSNQSFEDTFGFKFEDSISTIVSEIADCFHKTIPTNRNTFKTYNGK